VPTRSEHCNTMVGNELPTLRSPCKADERSVIRRMGIKYIPFGGLNIRRKTLRFSALPHQAIIPAATVLFVASSITMKLPVARSVV